MLSRREPVNPPTVIFAMVISGTASALSDVSFRLQNWEKMLKTFALLF
jgi:hypothetical protein